MKKHFYYLQMLVKALIKRALNKILFLLVMYIKPDENSVICGGWSGKRFADNSKAMFLFLAQNKEKLNLNEIVFITKSKEIIMELKSKGYKALYANSLLSIKKHIQCKYHIIDQTPMDINPIFSVNRVRINLWHGFPLKKIGLMATNVKNYQFTYSDFFRKSIIGNWHDYITIGTSKKHRELLAASFNLKHEQVIIALYPRIVYMLGNIKRVYLFNEKQFFDRIKKIKREKKQIIGYFPTFRDLEEHNEACVKTIEKLNQFAKLNNSFILTKLHIASKTTNKIDLSYVLNLPSESDLYNFLGEVDVLITDYSSIYFDYLMYNRPILFYCFDYDYYLTKDRGFNFDYNAVTPGEKSKTFTELSTNLISVLLEPSTYLKKHEKQRDYIKKIVYDNKTSANFKDMISLWRSILLKTI